MQNVIVDLIPMFIPKLEQAIQLGDLARRIYLSIATCPNGRRWNTQDIQRWLPLTPRTEIKAALRGLQDADMIRWQDGMRWGLSL